MKRSAFTLIEMVTAMTIMAILLGIALIAYGQSIESAKVSATRATVLQLHRAVNYRRELVGEYNTRSLAQTLKAQYDTAGNPSPADRLPVELAQLLVRKNRYRAALPQRLEDLWGIDAQPGTVDDSPLWQTWKRTCNDNGLPVSDATPRPAGHRLDLENSELLYLALSNGAAYGDQSDTVERLNPAHVTDANDNGLNEIIDAWGNPIRFYNFPTRFVRPGGNGQPIDQSVFAATARQFMAMTPPPSSPSPFPNDDFTHPINNDADDPLGTLSAAQAAGYLAAPFQLNRNPFGSTPDIITCQPFDEANYHTADTYWAPLAISAGLDGRLGLSEPTEQTAPERRNADLESLDDVLDNVGVLP